jgi:hypothetical protein
MSKASRWGIAAGVFVAFLGLVIIASGLGSRQADGAPLAAGLAIFAFGVLAIAASFYCQALSLRSQIPADPSLSASGRRKQLCSVCRKALPVILCTMHKVALCSACLSEHYDSRGCVYVPAVRRVGTKNARTAAASRS